MSNSKLKKPFLSNSEPSNTAEEVKKMYDEAIKELAEEAGYPTDKIESLKDRCSNLVSEITKEAEVAEKMGVKNSEDVKNDDNSPVVN